MSDTTRHRRRLIFAIFTTSGFSGLIYESVWSHYLNLFLGHAAYAQTLVLAIFMGGMAIGSWLMARYSHRIANLLLGYAIVEGVIGFFGLVFHRISTSSMAWAFDTLLPHLDSVAGAQVAKWTLGAALILPQSILLGMTFPLMSGATVRRFPERSGETLAMLYFTNSFGAAVGVLVSGFVLIRAVGLPGTMMTAGLLNIGLALFVWGIAKHWPDMVIASQPSAENAKTRNTPERAPTLLYWMLIGATVTGAASFFYEIAWIRMLSLVLGSSTHSFEMMLSAFILGIALGGFWVHRRIDALSNPLRFLSSTLLIMAGVALLSLPIYNEMFDLMAQVITTFASTAQGYVGISIASNVIAMLVMIPTTFFCGMTLPVITHIILRGGAGERAIGAVYAWNTAGAIVGVVVAVHLLMPIVGLKGIVVAGAILQVALGTVYRSKAQGTGSAIRKMGGPAVAGVTALIIAAIFFQLDPAKLASGVFRHGHATNSGEVRFLEYGRTATITLVDDHGSVSIATNGKPDAAIMTKGPKATPDEITMVLAGAIPTVLHSHPRRIANIGLGSGLTSHVVLANPTVETLDTVEIEPVMAKAARSGFMPRVRRTFEDPRSHIHFEDAKTFFAMHKKKYDVIISEPSNPWVSGVATLFSEEFYQQMTRYLEPDGMFVQWIQIYEADMNIVTSVMKAMAPHFSDFAIYNTDDSNLLIVATRSGQLPVPGDRAFAIEAMAKELKRVGITTPRDIQGRFLGNKALLEPLLRHSGVPVNSDYFPFIDQHAARTRILRRNAVEFTELHLLPVPLFELLQGKAESRRQTLPPTDPMTERDRMAETAVALRQAIESDRYETLDAELMRILLTLQSSEQECARPAVRRAWLSSAAFIAAQTNSQLSAEELQPVWDRISATPCAKLLETRDSRMLTLMQSIAARDVEKTASIGAQILKDGYPFSEPSQAQLVLLATAASEIGSNRTDAALEVLARNPPQTAAAAPPVRLALNWMTAIANDRGTAGSTTRGADASAVAHNALD